MIRLLIRLLIMLLANAIGLIVAWLILKPKLSIDGVAFVIAVGIFTLVEVLIDPLLTKIALSSVPALRGSVALVTTLVGLIITALVSSGLTITGLSTWIFATVIVWLAALLAGLILPVFLVKKAVDNNRR